MITTLKGHTDGVNSVAWSVDGSQLVSGADDKKVRVWDVEAGQQSSMAPAQDKIRRVAFHPNGKHVIAASSNLTTLVYELPLQQDKLRYVPLYSATNAIAVPPNQTEVFVTTGGTRKKGMDDTYMYFWTAYPHEQAEASDEAAADKVDA